jgi:hypothetical protein
VKRLYELVPSSSSPVKKVPLTWLRIEMTSCDRVLKGLLLMLMCLLGPLLS